MNREAQHLSRLLESRLDAGETPFVTRELLAVKARLFEIKYPTLIARTLMPIATDTDPGADTIAYHELDATGAAKIIGPNAKDIPRVDVKISESTSPVKTLGAAYGFEWHEMKAAAFARKPLPMWKAQAARRAIEQGIDDVLAEGDTDSGLKGLVNHSSVTSAGATGNWSGLTAAQIVTDVNTALLTVLSDTKGIFPATKCLLPVTEYARIAMTPWSSTGASDTTVLKFLQANNPGVQFIPWYRLESVSGSKRMVVYNDSSEVLEGEIPLDFEVLPPEAQGLDLVYNCLARVGGVVLRQPKAMRYITGL
jgi:hypothetical protein